MVTYPSFSLNADWTCDYIEPEPPTLHGFANSIAVASLRGWSPEKRCDHYSAAWVHKSFGLEILDMCVNYMLHIESAPSNTVLYLNDARLALIEQSPFQINVTDVITWEANTLAFRVPCGEESAHGGVFGDIVLRAIPCDSAP